MRSVASVTGQHRPRRNRTNIPEWPDPDLPAQYPVSSGWVDIDAGIDSTGATDVSAAIMAFFAALDPGAKVRFAAGGTYRVDSGLEFVGYDNLSIDGNGSTFTTDVVSDYAIFKFTGCTDIYVTSCICVGPQSLDVLANNTFNSAYERAAGFYIKGGERILIEDCTVTNVFGDFGSVFRTDDLQIPKHITFRNWTGCNDCSRMGFSIVFGEDFLVDNCEADRVGRACFDIEPIGGTVLKRIKFRNCTFNRKGLNFLSNGGAPVYTEDVLCENNTVTAGVINGVVNDSRTPGIRRNVIFRNNTAGSTHNTSGNATFNFWGVDGLEVTGNVQPMAGADMRLAGVGECYHWGVWGNTVAGGAGDYILKGEPVDYGFDPSDDFGSFPTHVGTTLYFKASSISPLPITLPAGTAENDIAILAISGTKFGCSPPTGFSQIALHSIHEGGPTFDKQGILVVWWKRVTAADVSAGSYSIPVTHPGPDGSGVNRMSVVLRTFRNAGNPYGMDGYRDAAGIGAEVIFPAAPTLQRSTAVFVMSQRRGAGDWAVGYPAHYGYTADTQDLVSQESNSGIEGATLGMAHADIPGTGAVARRLFLSGQNDQRAATMFFLPYWESGSFDVVTDTTNSAGPFPTTVPVLSGTAQVGQTMTCTPPSWEGAHTPVTNTYQWYDTNVSVNGGLLAGETSSTITVPAGSLGYSLICYVTGTDAVGTTYVFITSWSEVIVAA